MVKYTRLRGWWKVKRKMDKLSEFCWRWVIPEIWCGRSHYVMSGRRTECGRKAFDLVLMRCYNVILYFEAENDSIFIKPEFQNIPISSTGHSTVHRTESRLWVLYAEHNESIDVATWRCWRAALNRLLARCERLGKILGTERKVNAVTLGLCMVSGERVSALTCTRLFWACKPRYKTGVSHVRLHYPLNFKIYVINFWILAHSVWQCVRFLLTKK